MRNIRVYFNHDPSGEANSFIKSLHPALKQTGQIDFAEDIGDDYDVLFLDEFKTGVRSDSLANSFKKGFEEYMRIRDESGGSKKIVVRAINLKRHSRKYGFLNWMEDRRKIKLLNCADMVIFQSRYQKSFFVKYGYKGKKDVVIHNGADPSIFYDVSESNWNGRDRLKIISCSISNHSLKQHDIIVRVSGCKDIEVSHIGRWPDSIDNKNVKLLGILGREQVAEALRHSHVFLHPATKDVCPSVVFEAICCGLPVIYNSEIGSSREIVLENGLPINVESPLETIEQIRKNYRMIKENIKRSLDHYTIKRVAIEYLEAFSKILPS